MGGGGEGRERKRERSMVRNGNANSESLLSEVVFDVELSQVLNANNANNNVSAY